MPSFILIRPTIGPEDTNVIDRQTRQDRTDRQRTNSTGRTVLQTVAQKLSKTTESNGKLTKINQKLSKYSTIFRFISQSMFHKYTSVCKHLIKKHYLLNCFICLLASTMNTNIFKLHSSTIFLVAVLRLIQ